MSAIPNNGEWTFTPTEPLSKTFDSFFTEADNPGGNPRKNVIWTEGYNPHRDSGDHSFFFNLESCYGPAGSEQIEWYPEFWNAAQTVGYRPFGIVANRVTGVGSVNFVSDRVDFANRADENAAIPFIMHGPIDIRAGLSGNNGAISYTLYHTAGTYYFTGDTSYGLRWDLRGGVDIPGISNWAATGYTHKHFEAQVNGVSVWSIDHDGSITGAANLNLAALPTADPHVAGRVWRSANDLKISTG